MTDEKPLTEQPEAPENSTASAPTNETDGIAAALSALSSAAAPVRDEDASPEASAVPAPVAATVSFTPASSASAETAQTAPPPPPAPESAEDYPPPTGAPVAVSAVPSAAAVPPAAAAKRKKWPWILAICIVAGVIFLGGMAACTSAMMKAAFHVVQHNEHSYEYGDRFFDPAMDDGFWNYYYGGMDTTFDDLLDIFNVDAGDIATDGMYAEGAYRVGGDDGIAPGLYYLEGSQRGVSNYYVFESDGDADEPRYEVRAMVEYFGNYYADLEEGDAIIFLPYSPSSVMHLAQEPMDVVPPYQSGCYRVGIDIPAGTYTITCDAEAARETDSEAGAYVMTNLDFEDDSISESVYVIKGGRQTISVEAGEYLELFAAIATPATASTKVPLQHIESEYAHAA